MYLTQPLTFRKSSYSTTAQECVEVADVPGASAVRDSTQPDLGHLAFPSIEWTAFLGAAQR
ncbi:DUF397 domain-containing protein [Nocardiopsis sp. CNR-923]|uniref:DUF397 domain-containing protein n=1 Tax=Nocardiopsis sp. CNR-923 TaxID=1904965 RepID=UPI00096776B4|nr:DUF397 domain-containing protein [Nocardiopsis sp. CNR-923]OLT26642.1 DUF397 domain-containing protein [Nocardiopsis sp. CNR-923]